MADEPADYGDFFNKFISYYRDNYSEEHAALAENIAQNSTASVRQQRNQLREDVKAGKEFADYVKEAELELAPQNEKNLELSFKVHLRALAKRDADIIGQQINARSFMGVSPKSDPVVLQFDEYHKKNFPSIGPSPVSETLAIPIPPQYTEEQIQAAKDLLLLSPKERIKAMNEKIIARARM